MDATVDLEPPLTFRSCITTRTCRRASTTVRPASGSRGRDAVQDHQDLVDGQGHLRIWVGLHLHAPVGRPRVVLYPQLAPSRVDDDGIAGLERQVLPVERLLQVLHRDLVGVGQHIHPLQRGDVKQHAARDEGADLVHTSGGRCLVDLEAVVPRAPGRQDTIATIG
jgi:hypothetical protein